MFSARHGLPSRTRPGLQAGANHYTNNGGSWMDGATIDSLCWQMTTFKRLTLTAHVRCNAPLCQSGPHNSSSTVTRMYASWKAKCILCFEPTWN